MDNVSNAIPLNKELLPALPLEEWKDTKVTLHLYLQIIGKIKLSMCPKVNHWWHIPFYVSSAGLTTRLIPNGFDNFEIEFDFITHELKIKTSRGALRSFPLYDGLSVSLFHKQVFENLSQLGIKPKIWGVPYGIPITEPFKSDNKHASYKKEYIERYRQILSAINIIFEEFRGRYNGKSTPVHLFWHSFDLALTRFSGRPAELWDGAGKVDSEAYSHEVISFGFWAGDENIPFPAFYSYTYPQPEGLTREPINPPAAYWGSNRGSALALLPYEEVRKSGSLKSDVLDFLESTFRAGAKHW